MSTDLELKGSPMDRLLVALASLAIAPAVFATGTWTSVIEPREESLIFVDLTRIEIKGAVVSAWSLRNQENPNKLPSGASYMSLVHRYEIDCKRSTIRTLQIYAYSEAFAGGQAVASSNEANSQGTQPPPNSVGELIANFVCARALTSRTRVK